MKQQQEPDGVVYSPHALITELKSCGMRRDIHWGRKLHAKAVASRNHEDMYVMTALIHMYAKCGSVVDARYMFNSVKKPDVVSWTAIIMGYADNGEGMVSLAMLSRMEACGCEPNSVTYLAALKACTSLADGHGKQDCLNRGREIHFKMGCHRLNSYVQSTLIDMYAKCGSMVDACAVFDSIQKPDVVSWNAMVMGYAENGEGLIALEMFSLMKERGCKPDSITYVAALKACGLVGALVLGRKFHQEISEIDSYLVTGLVDFYAKCGSMVESRRVFDLHPRTRDASTWTALLAGYGSLGHSDVVFNLFEAMQDEGFRPDAVTFVCMLLCCSHAGLVDKGMKYFEVMRLKYGISPNVMHYNCMVGTLGRANQLNEAIAMIRKMPCNPDIVTWRTLLGACRKWKNLRIGKSAFQALVDIDKKDASAYVVMAQIYGSLGMWEEQERVLETSGAWTLPGQAYLMDDRMGEMCGGFIVRT